MPSVVDITKELYETLYQLLSDITVDGIEIPVISVTGGYSELGTYIELSQAEQAWNGTKLTNDYQTSILVEVVHKSSNYALVQNIVNEILARVYYYNIMPLASLTHAAYIIGMPTINELVEDLGSEIYIRKLIRISYLIS